MAMSMQNKLNYRRVIALWCVVGLCWGGCDSFSKEKWNAYNANSGGALLEQWLNPVFRYEPNVVSSIDVEAISIECAGVVRTELDKIAKGGTYYYPRPLLVKMQKTMTSGIERTQHSAKPHDLLSPGGKMYSMVSTYLGLEADILSDRLYAVLKNDDDTVDVAVQYVALFDNSFRRPRIHFMDSECNYHGIGVGCIKHNQVFTFLAGDARFTLDGFLPKLKSGDNAALYWGHGNSGLGIGRHRYKADEFEKWLTGQEHIYPMKLILVSKCMYFFSCLTPCAVHTQ
ncbi:MAG: hypothetical protein IJG84_17505 [Kiritimatiellae bacterium]|nr:hypothetical protein [Kiritimatiellia bacterium]